MAWEFVGIGSVATSSSGNITLNLPSGTQEGDLLVACIAYRDNNPFSVPSGWTEIAQEVIVAAFKPFDPIKSADASLSGTATQSAIATQARSELGWQCFNWSYCA